MPNDSDKRYIVKIISIPASQVQLDALLLAGAYTSRDSALAYFKELADGISVEADVLKKLSRFEGFIPFDDLQIVPKEDQSGYDVYLLSSYKRSLEKHMRKKPMTHLNAVNLGLDLCASMVVCRRMGYLYVDLKPSNIYINEKQEFRIGDLGFMKLDSLKYASLPDKYRSTYTAPEISDAWSAMNDTLDTYAIGMILYQVYNDGKLPFTGQAGTEELPPPLYADYEMAEIILKAVAPDPELRWTDPMLMGQALVAYMQRNTVNDVPIVPLPISDPKPSAQVTDAQEPETPSEEAVPAGDETSGVDEASAVSPEPDVLEPTADPEEDPADPPDTDLEVATVIEAGSDQPVPEENTAPVEDELTDLSFMDNMVSDDTAPDARTADEVEYAELSDETSDMLSLADELIALEMPEPVVAPEPIDVPIPEPIVLTDDPEPTPAEDASDIEQQIADAPEQENDGSDPQEESLPTDREQEPDADLAEDSSEDEADAVEDTEAPVDDTEKKPRRWGGVIAIAVIIALLAAALFGGCHYYNNYYLQTVDSLRLEGDANDLIVIVDSQVDESLLTVVCTDTYGTTRQEPVENGKATFEDLNPDTIYQIKVVIDGFHELRGDISDDYTTPAQTNIVRFDAIAGSEDGSVVLNFTVDGKDSDTWTVTYSAEGEQTKSVTFSGKLVTVNGLVLDKEYTFTLSGPDSMYIVGNDTVNFTAAALVYAQGLDITACNSNGLTAVWSAPEGVAVESWLVRCYSDTGYDQTATTTELTYTFTDIDPALGYTVEVIAQGMSVGSRDYVSANSATITGFQADTSVPMELTVTWDYTGSAPEAGWIVLYNLQGSDKQEVIQTSLNSATITNAMPGGTYDFIIQASDGTTVFDGTYTCTAGEVEIFSGYGVSAENMTVYMVHTPEVADWDRYDLNWDDYTNTYAPGDKVSLLIQLDTKYNTSYDLITTMFVVRDMDGNLICTSTSESSWIYMWYQFYCELDIPTMPTAPGEYNLNVYFNNKAISQLQFTITGE